MLALKIENETRRLAEQQDEYFALSIRDSRLDSGAAIMTSAWELTPRELRILENGGAVVCNWSRKQGEHTAGFYKPDFADLMWLKSRPEVFLRIPGHVHPPVQMFVASKEDLPDGEPENLMCVIHARRAQ